jgi:hypothetical protein
MYEVFMAKAKPARAPKVSNLVSVPKPSRAAYNPNRPLQKNQLIQAQVKHFQEADRQLPPELQTGIDVTAIKTEGEASQYIRKVTRAIHKAGERPQKVQKARR